MSHYALKNNSNPFKENNMQFVARIGGKTVSYDQSATFVIKRKEGRGRFGIVGMRQTLNAALSKFHRTEKPGCTTTLSPVVDGRVLKPIARA